MPAQNAASVAGLMLTIAAVVAEQPKKDAGAGAYGMDAAADY